VQEAPFRKRRGIAGEARLVLAAALQIFEREVRQTAMRHRAQIFDRHGALEIASGVEPAARRAREYGRRRPSQIPVGRSEGRRHALARQPGVPASGRQDHPNADGRCPHHEGEAPPERVTPIAQKR
jgi:hypothetical protein